MSLRTIEYATNTYKKYFYTFTINKIIFTNGERKKERPNFFGMFSQNLPISTAFIAILEMELPQCNAIGVRTPPAMPQSEKSKRKNCRFVEIKNLLSLSQNVAPFPSVFSGCRFSGTRLSLHFLTMSLLLKVAPFLSVFFRRSVHRFIGTRLSPHFLAMSLVPNTS